MSNIAESQRRKSDKIKLKVVQGSIKTFKTIKKDYFIEYLSQKFDEIVRNHTNRSPDLKQYTRIEEKIASGSIKILIKSFSKLTISQKIFGRKTQ